MKLAIKALGLAALVASCGDNFSGNRPPTIADVTVMTPAATPVMISLMANDPDGDPLTFSTATPAHGTLTGTAPLLTYTPSAGFAGSDVFTATVSDGKTSATASITVLVAQRIDAVDDTATVAEDSPLEISASTLLANDVKAPGATATITGVSDATNGTVTLAGDVIRFSPAENFNGSASFRYTSSDGANSDTATVVVTVTPVNDPPVAVADAFATAEDTLLELTDAQLLTNDTDVDGDTLTVTGAGNATHGMVMQMGGMVIFAPELDFQGDATFEYTISDGTATVSQTVTVGVGGVNDAPVAVVDDVTTPEDTLLTLSAASLVANDQDADGDTLTITQVGAATNGTIAFDGTQIEFTPNANYHGPASFTYTVTDGLGTAEGTVNITVTPVNDAPVAVGDSASTAEDTVGVFAAAALLANDADVDGDLLSVTQVSDAVNGTVSFDGTNATFIPAPGFNGVGGFTYTVSDGNLVATAVVQVTVTPVNDTPVAVADVASTDEDQPLVVAAATLLGNDSDPDGDALAVTQVSAGVNGTVAFDGTSITFTPNANFNGTGSFVYEISDGAATASAQVTVTVNPINDAPVAVADTLSTAEDQAVVVAAATLTANDTDLESDALSVTAVGGATNGTVALAGGNVTFTPAADFNGTASFTYTVTDGSLTATGTVTVTVTAVNDAPVAVNDTRTTNEDVALVVTAASLVANDTDVDGPALSVSAVGGATNGTVALAGGNVTFTPAANFNGTASFTYTVTDGSLTATGTVTVTVTAVNDAPVAVNDTRTTNEDVALVVTGASLVANDTDPDGQALSVSAVGGATNGTVALAGGNVTFTPAANFNGTASFTYTVTDGSLTATGTVTVTVTAVNDAPVAVNDTRTTNEDVALVVTAASLVANDTDVDGPALSVSAVGGATNGTVALAGGNVTFTPAANFNGTASFTYTVTDGSLTATGTVTVTVTAVNDAPVAVNDTRTTNEDVALVVTGASLVANDTDPDGQALSVSAVGGATNGTVALAGGNVTFTPAANFNGTASFTYTVTDGSLTATGTVTVTVTAVNDAPVAVNDTRTTDEDVALVVTAASLVANDTDVDGPALSVSAVGGATNGTVALAGGNVTFTPAANFNGTASFTYTVTDGSLSATGTVTVTVTAVNDAPVAVADSANTNEDNAVAIAASALLANDTDVDGPALTVTAVGGATNGTVALAGSTITFTPTADFAGTGLFTYTVSDGTSSATGAVTVTVAPVNDAPVAVADAATTAEDMMLTLSAASLVANDTDVDGPALSISAVSSATNGVVALAGTDVTFTPAANFAGTASFTYTVTDGALTASATVTITVTPVNDLPVAVSDSVATRKNIPLGITLAATDAENDPLTYVVDVAPTNGMLTGTAPNLTYTPNTNYVGADSFTFHANDGSGNSAIATIAISVTEPVCGNNVVEAPEVCDDGNTVAGDGCRADCRGLEDCGDGIVDGIVGEECDDGNNTDGDGCESNCKLPPFVSVAPTVISGTLTCNTNSSNTGRKSAVDELGRFFVIMNCGGTAYVNTSLNRGATWGTPLSTGMTGVQMVAIEGGPTGIAYAVAKTSANTILFTRTTDAGATWETPRVIATGISDAEVSIDSYGDEVYVAVSTGQISLLRNYTKGVGAFVATSVTISNVFHDVILDKVSGHVILASDDPAFHLRRSTDQGLTFGAESAPPGQAFYSDWAGSNGFIYAVGTNGDNNIDRIPLSAPGTSTQVTGLPTNVAAASVRSIDADAIGNAYVVSQLNTGAIQLDRMLFGAATISSSDARTVAASGTFPSVSGLPSNKGALVAYTAGTQVLGSVVVYP